MSNRDNEKNKLLEELNILRARVAELDTQISLNPDMDTEQQDKHPSVDNNFSRFLMNAIPDMVWIKDANGVYLACNDAFESLFGVKEAELVGKTDYNFVDKSLADFFRERDKLAMKAGKSCSNEEWLTLAKTGEQQLVETIKTPVKNDRGVLIGILGVARNITDRKRAEEGLVRRVTALTRSLDSSENVEFIELFDLEKIQRLQDEFSAATGVASMITAPDGTAITKPSNFCQLCKIIRNTENGRANCKKSDAMIGQPKSDGPTISLCMSGGLWDAGAAISVGGHHVANWLVGQVRDESMGEEKMRDYAREIGVDEDAFVEAFLKIPPMSRDRFSQISKVLYTLASQLSDIAYQNTQQARFINELENTKKELSKIHNYLSSMIDSMPSLLIGVDVNCLVTQWNMEAVRVTGISAQQARGQLISDVLPRMGPVIHHIKDAISSRTPRSDSLQTNILCGDVVYENVTVYPLRAKGVEGAVVRIDNVTDRIKMERMIIQSEKMMSVGGLAAGMAHEINNPLAGILGYIFNIKKRTLEDNKKNKSVAAECDVALEDVRKYLLHRGIPRMFDGIQELGTRAANIVLNMLSFSRKSEAKFLKCDVSELLNKTLELAANDFNLKKHYDFKKIEIVREYDESVPQVFCESNELQQVFLNLLKNGAEAMMDKAYIDDHPRFICRVKYEDEMVIVQIEDNGPGIDESTRVRIFEPFYTTKSVGLGTGLGLSVSYFIITDHHKGFLEVDSALGEWTRFTIKIPMMTNGVVSEKGIPF